MYIHVLLKSVFNTYTRRLLKSFNVCVFFVTLHNKKAVDCVYVDFINHVYAQITLK